MEDNIQKIFTTLKRVTPDSDYLARSKAAILLSVQDPVRPRSTLFSLRERLTLAPALAFGAFLLLIVAGGAFLSPSAQIASAPAISNTEALTREASQADFSLKIAEAQYFDESAAQVALALDEIAEDTNSNDVP